jgi:hypothetical protein
MNIRLALASAAAISALAVMVGGSALGQAQNTDQQKCINKLNKDTSKVAAAQGKENSACVKAGTKGEATSGCLTADPKQKVQKKKTKTSDDETKNECLGANEPDFGYSSAAVGNAAAQDQEINLFEDVYGTTDPTGVISTNKLEGGCQSAVTKDVEKLIAAKFKQYLKCKKDALKNGASSGAALEACLSGDPNSVAADPKGKIGKKVTKLGDDITKKCTGVNVGTTFPGDCSATSVGTPLRDCLDRLAECRLCLAVNDIDGIDHDCDTFDDGAANGSCAGIALHKCALTGGIANSYVNIYSAAFSVPIAFDTSGSAIDIGGAGTVGKCEIQNFNPIFIIGIGFVCINPGSGCPNGVRNCGPGAGPALGIDVRSDGDIGSCTGNPNCETQCDAFCPTLGAGFTQLNSGCTAFCTEGSGNTACTSDDQCADLGEGACNGPDNPSMAQQGICQCTCIKTDAFGASDPGDVQCNLGADLTVEMAAPCNGTDLLIDVGNACIPVSTQRAKGRIVDGNFVPGSTVPSAATMCTPPGSPDGSHCNDQSGSPLACATVDSSDTTGLAGVGAVNFFGSTIGDLSVGLKATCQ